MTPLATLALAVAALSPSEPPRFDRIVIDDRFPDAYQVEVADVDGDGRPDIVALGGKAIAWYRNPGWTKRTIASGTLPADVISSATADLDGDGRAEVAIACDFAMNEPGRGRLVLASQGPTIDDPWTFRTIAGVPSIHRLRWGDLDGDGRADLVVAPIFGPGSRPPEYTQDRAHLALFDVGPRPKVDAWRSTGLASRQVLHAIEVRRLPDATDGRASVLTADRSGISRVDLTRTGPGLAVDPAALIPGADRPGGAGGSSEVHLGRLADGRPFLATIDPWHGSEVAIAVGREPGRVRAFGPRTVIDASLDDGHALWVADLDRDGTDEVFAGHRGKGARVSVYRLEGTAWNRTVIDESVAAQDLRGGDLDGDGTPDVVAVGGRTGNVVWYRPIPAGRR